MARYVIVYGDNDGSQAKELASELREIKHKTVILDSNVIQFFDVEGEVQGVIFTDNVGKLTRHHVAEIFKGAGVPTVFFDDVVDGDKKETAARSVKATDTYTGDDRPGRVRAGSRKAKR